MDKYLSILGHSYVLNLINSVSSYQVVKLEENYYIKDGPNLTLITEDIRRTNNEIFIILITCIHFEKYKDEPLEGYIEIVNSRFEKNWNEHIDSVLLNHLQNQYSLDKNKLL